MYCSIAWGLNPRLLRSENGNKISIQPWILHEIKLVVYIISFIIVFCGIAIATHSIDKAYHAPLKGINSLLLRRTIRFIHITLLSVVHMIGIILAVALTASLMSNKKRR